MADQKMKVHKLRIKNKPDREGKLSTGATMEVTLDGQPLRGVSFFKFEVKAAGVAKVMIEMFAEVDVEVEAALDKKKLKGTGYKTSNGKALGIYELGNFHPKEIVTQSEESAGCANAEADKKPYCDNCGCGKKAAFEKKNLPKCQHCPKPVEAAHYKMCYDCWWARDPRNQNVRNK